MKLVAKDEKGNIVNVRASYRIHVNTEFGRGEVSIPDSDVHLSTGMLDKNGNEILDIHLLHDKHGCIWKVMWDGCAWYVFSSVGMEWQRDLLTPELAATLEVVE